MSVTDYYCYKSPWWVSTQVPRTCVLTHSQLVNVPWNRKGRVFVIGDVSLNYDRHYTDLHSSAMDIPPPHHSWIAATSSCHDRDWSTQTTATYHRREFPFNYFVRKVAKFLLHLPQIPRSRNYRTRTCIKHPLIILLLFTWHFSWRKRLTRIRFFYKTLQLTQHISSHFASNIHFPAHACMVWSVATRR
jgi:hypothetical protein